MTEPMPASFRDTKESLLRKNLLGSLYPFIDDLNELLNDPSRSNDSSYLQKVAEHVQALQEAATDVDRA